MYLRLFLTDILDFSGKKILYLDSDTIVDGSLLPLLNYDLRGNSIGMVLESIRDNNYKVMIGMMPDSDYYNSGVILFDVDKWKANRYCEKIVEHINSVRSSYIGDQDYINIICEGDICRLPMIYNYQPLHGRYSAKDYFGAYGLKSGSGLVGYYEHNEYYSVDEIEKASDETVIYHCYRWLGTFPWNRRNLHPFNKIFDKYLAQSLWKGYVKTTASTGLLIRIERLMYILLPRRVLIKIFKKAHEMMLKNAEKDARQMKTNERA